MQRLVGSIIVIVIFAMAAQSHDGTVIKVPRLNTAPTIDGDLSDWEGQGWSDGVWDSERIKSGSWYAGLHDWAKPRDVGGEPAGTAETPQDITGQYFMAWDDAGLYLGVRATDNVHDVSTSREDPSTWYLKDGCAFFFDLPHDGDGAEVYPGDHVFAMVADTSYPEGGSWWRHGENAAYTLSDVQVGMSKGWRVSRSWLEVQGSWSYRVTMQSNTDYTIEAFIPFHNYWFTTPAIGDTIGTMIVHTDPDGGAQEFGGQLQVMGASDDDGTWADLIFVGAKK